MTPRESDSLDCLAELGDRRLKYLRAAAALRPLNKVQEAERDRVMRSIRVAREMIRRDVQ